MKIKYHIVGIGLKCNRQIIEQAKIDTLIDKCMTSPFPGLVQTLQWKVSALN